MPLRLNVGLSRKLGLPHYASVGASCAVELELEPLLFHDTGKLQERIQEAFSTCRQAVEEELSRHEPSELPPAANGDDPLPPSVATTSTATSNTARPGNSIVPLATERQVEFAYHLAREIRSLGGQRLPVLVEQLYGRSLAELNTAECSRLIGLLKDVRSGTRSVDELLADAAA